MVDVIDGSETVSTHGIVNWILLLVIFSVGLERYDSNCLYHYWNLPWICINCTHSFSSKRYPWC